MQVANKHQYENLEFETYRSLPGKSFSELKYEDKKVIAPSYKMMFGSAVDCYLFTPDKYHGAYYDKVKPVALQLKRKFGESLTHGKAQLSLTADFIHEDMCMHYKGRPDLKIFKTIVDLKVSELPIRTAIEFFRYDWALTGYAAASDATNALIISIHPKSNAIQMSPVIFHYDWWHYNIKKFGKSLINH